MFYLLELVKIRVGFLFFISLVCVIHHILFSRNGSVTHLQDFIDILHLLVDMLYIHLFVFLLRSVADWQRAWHSECHRKCRHDLRAHIMLTCALDIYKVTEKRATGPKTGVIS